MPKDGALRRLRYAQRIACIDGSATPSCPTMANYADATRTPRTLTEHEQRALLKVTGEHRAGFRDHVLSYSSDFEVLNCS